jgi:HIV Tat-specific factor 1
MYVTNTHDIPKKSVPVMTIQAMACNPTTEQNDITTEDIQHYFVKAGLLDLDPETLQPKIKLYRDHDTGRLKGDASVCYARSESVDLALQVLDDSLWDVNHRIKVERAHFEAKEEHDGSHGDANNSGKDSTSTMNINDNDNKLAITNRKRNVSQAQRKVARLALLQAQDDGFGERLAGGRKGLRIIVIKHLMEGIPENTLEDVLHETLGQYGQVEKITAITKTQIVIVKYVEPLAASEALEALHGRVNPRNPPKRIEATYWDGVTDYTQAQGDEEKERQEEEKRHEEFGKWLESQEEDLPPELRLQVAGCEEVQQQ